MKFEIGQIVEHILSKDWLLILEIDLEKKQYFCRTKNHTTYWFQEFEVRGK